MNEEVDEYNKLKDEIIKKIKSQFTDFDTKVLIDYGYEKGVDEFIENISNNRIH